MLTDHEARDPEPQHTCDECGRSMVARFGGDTPFECDSCEADFNRLSRAGKLILTPVEESAGNSETC